MAELPVYTIEIARLFNAPASAEGFEDRYRAEHKALLRVLGRDGLAEAVGSDRFEDCDLSALEAEFTRVKAEFEAPQGAAVDEQIARISERLDRLPVDKLAKVAEIMDRPQVRRGFRAVK